MIEGVKITKINKFEDERGFLAESSKNNILTNWSL